MPTQRRSFPWWWLGGGLCVLIAGLWWFGRSSIDAELAALRAQGLPVTAAEINNFYSIPAGVRDSTELWVEAIDGLMATKFSVAGKGLPIVGVDESVPAPGNEWPKREAAKQLITERAPQLRAVWRAAAVGGHARYPADFSGGMMTPLPYVQNAREVVRFVVLDAHLAAHDGDYDRVLKDLRAVFAVSD